MATLPQRVERRVGQRFPYLLPVSLRHGANPSEVAGFTQDLSSRGVFLFCALPLREGDVVELTLRMPSEITLAESMPVRCKGRVLRVTRPAAEFASSLSPEAETKIGVAVKLEQYEYLPERDEAISALPRLARLHAHAHDEQPLVQHPLSRIAG